MWSRKRLHYITILGFSCLLTDFAILRDDLWYRIPVASAPKPSPPEWLAFYQTRIFNDAAFAVRYYGHISKIKAVMRRELFPQEMHNPNAPHWIMTATTI